MTAHHRWRFPQKSMGQSHAFSLVEVMVALGIFSVGIAVILRLFAGISDSIRVAGESEAGIHAAEALIGRLRTRPFGEVSDCLMTAEEFKQMDSSGRPDLSLARRLFFANPAADRIGPEGDPLWLSHEKERYFEIALVRDETLSPRSEDERASCLVFTVCIRWPAAVSVGAHRAMLSGSVFRRP